MTKPLLIYNEKSYRPKEKLHLGRLSFATRVRSSIIRPLHEEGVDGLEGGT